MAVFLLQCKTFVFLLLSFLNLGGQIRCPENWYTYLKSTLDQPLTATWNFSAAVWLLFFSAYSTGFPIVGGCPPSNNFFRKPPSFKTNAPQWGTHPPLKNEPPPLHLKNKLPIETWSTLPWNDSKKKHNK